HVSDVPAPLPLPVAESEIRVDESCSPVARDEDGVVETPEIRHPEVLDGTAPSGEGAGRSTTNFRARDSSRRGRNSPYRPPGRWSVTMTSGSKCRTRVDRYSWRAARTSCGGVSLAGCWLRPGMTNESTASSPGTTAYSQPPGTRW